LFFRIIAVVSTLHECGQRGKVDELARERVKQPSNRCGFVEKPQEALGGDREVWAPEASASLFIGGIGIRE
jgi:hypothetical protein